MLVTLESVKRKVDVFELNRYPKPRSQPERLRSVNPSETYNAAMAINYLSILRMKLRSIGRTNAEVFDGIYSNRRWGTNPDSADGISSGSGSFAENTKLYEDLVCSFVSDNDIRTIADVGCGDFQVSRRILRRLSKHVEYTGLDVSRFVVDRNTALFSDERTRFIQHDATLERIPRADLVLIREVMQHLPNADIKKILANIDPASHVLATNTIALRPRKINMDLPAGSASRAGLGSGLALDLAPFNCRVEELLRVPHAKWPTEIVTVRILRANVAPV